MCTLFFVVGHIYIKLISKFKAMGWRQKYAGKNMYVKLTPLELIGYNIYMLVIYMARILMFGFTPSIHIYACACNRACT